VKVGSVAVDAGEELIDPTVSRVVEPMSSCHVNSAAVVAPC